MDLEVEARGGAPLGNQNAAKGKRWRDAILRSLARYTGKSVDDGLDLAAERLVKLAVEGGDKWAIDHIADRVDGKPKQESVIAGDPDNPIHLERAVRFVE